MLASLDEEGTRCESQRHETSTTVYALPKSSAARISPIGSLQADRPLPPLPFAQNIAC